jgi:phosphoserine phosphatase RsbU/P
MPIDLIVTGDTADRPGGRFTFDSERITIGRHSANSLVLTDDSRVVSNQHAELHLSADRPQLIDLGSTNFTLLNGRRLVPNQPYPVRDGDTFKIGPFSIRVVARGSEPSMPDQDDASSTTGGTTWDDLEASSSDPTRLRRTLSELAFLNELTREIGSARDVGEVVERVIQRSVRAIGAEQGVITLIQEAEEFEDAQGRTFVRTGGKEPFHVNQDLLGWMRSQMRPLRLDDVRSDPASRVFGWPRSLRTALCVPLIVRSELTGVLSLFNSRRQGGFSEEDQRLLTIIAGQSAQIIENARLHEEEKTLIKMQQELKTAYRIQEHLLPSEAPTIREYQVAGRSVPAEMVGGDYFDYIEISDTQWGLAVGDVSGKGLPAALVMANLQATLRAQAAWSESVAQCIERSNKLLCSSTSPGTFVTLFYGQLDLQAHTFTWTNAGHNRPFLVRPDGAIRTLTNGGLVLGVMPKQRYPTSVLNMNPGDTLVIYSDGVTECMDAQRREFGDEALKVLLHRTAGSPPEEVIEEILGALKRHARDTAPSDDITILVLRRN